MNEPTPNGAYTIPAVETMYRGIRFRSRLESRWAAFFDLCGWRWVYEPVDLNGWFPDFVLIGDADNHVYVEVKPTSTRHADLEARLEGSGCSDEILIVGLSPFPATTFMDCAIGWLYEHEWGMGWDEAVLFAPQCCRCGGRSERPMKYAIDFCHATASYHGRMSNEHCGSHHLGALSSDEVMRLWGEAHYRTRYEAASKRKVTS